jgi:hypothetical protein
MVRASIVGDAGGATYEMFDIVSVDADGARLVGPLLLEVGEEVTLRLPNGETETVVRARVTAVERGERDAVSVVAFVR